MTVQTMPGSLPDAGLPTTPMTDPQHQPPGFTAQVFGAAKWTALSRWGSLLISWPATIIVARLLAPQDFGYLALVTVFTRFAGMFAEGGIGTAVVLGKELTEEKYRRLHGWSIGFFGVICLLLTAAAIPIERFYTSPGLRWILLALTGALALEGLLVVPTARMRRMMRFRELAIVSSARVAVEASTSVACAVAGFAVWSLVLGHIAGRLLEAVLILRAYSLPPLLPRLAGLQQELTSSGQVFLGSMTTFVGRSSDAWIGAIAAGTAPLGGYIFMKGLAQAPVEKVSGIIQYVSGAVFGNVASEPSRLRNVIIRQLRLMAMVMLPIFAGMALVADDLVQGLLGAKWEPYVPAFQVYCAYAAFLPLISSLQQGVVAAGATRDYAGAGVIQLLIMPPCFFVLGREYGATGLAATWIIPLPLMLEQLTRALHRKIALRRRDVLRSLVLPLTAVAGMSAAVIGVGSMVEVESSHPIMRLTVRSLAGVAVYIAAISMLQREDVIWLLRRTMPGAVERISGWSLRRRHSVRRTSGGT